MKAIQVKIRNAEAGEVGRIPNRLTIPEKIFSKIREFCYYHARHDQTTQAKTCSRSGNRMRFRMAEKRLFLTPFQHQREQRALSPDTISPLRQPPFKKRLLRRRNPPGGGLPPIPRPPTISPLRRARLQEPIPSLPAPLSRMPREKPRAISYPQALLRQEPPCTAARRRRAASTSRSRRTSLLRRSSPSNTRPYRRHRHDRLPPSTIGGATAYPSEVEPRRHPTRRSKRNSFEAWASRVPGVPVVPGTGHAFPGDGEGALQADGTEQENRTPTANTKRINNNNDDDDNKVNRRRRENKRGGGGYGRS